MSLFGFPVYFKTIERELAPVLPFLKGRVLNAGCGNRDISAYLKQHHATDVENCDIQSSIPDAIICDLTSVPKEAARYDAILCNAVLEHVPNPIAVMQEFHRLLKDDGNLIISVPFLQPYHHSPTDFRRFTIEGLHQLSSQTGFTIKKISAVHSLAQTIGWILWAALEERGTRLGKALMWLPIFLLTRIFTSGPPNIKYTANSFQVLMVKSDE